MQGKNLTLRRQFLIRILSILLMIALVSGTVQIYLMKGQIVNQTNNQAEAIANNVLRAIQGTELATTTIEHQIDLKLVSYSKHIADLIKDKEKNEITNTELIKIRDQLGLAGITIFSETESKDDIVGFAATEKEEVGFSFKEAGFFEIGQVLLHKEKPTLSGATFTDKNIVVLPTAQSASHKDKPTFFKYAYYHVPDTKYIINPYIEANEVHNYIKAVGPNATIQELVQKNKIVQEIAVLNPKVFADPSLEKQLYPPLKKVEAGSFKLQTKKDNEFLTKSNIKKRSYIERVNGKKVYKMFLPLDENKVIYLALDYGKMSGPLYRHSIILIISGLISLIALFLLTARFFNRIYENIQKIKSQIQLLEEGKLTGKSEIMDGSELEKLSQSTNRMVDKLNKLVKDIQEQAVKTQRLSLLLEAEASQSVEKMYELSTENTIKSRDYLYEITEFLDEIIEVLNPYKENDNVAKIMDKVEVIRQVANERTAATTDMTITLSDLLHSLHGQSRELSDISNTLLTYMSKFKL
ncbi:HAMP domain-containing protein (plasmid) [Bacillus methanolicus]|uniref:methyl-accepting chemotaxis protein n=1 Tax=Bacillus methanolicus TaxID=1471 RepID=UPI00237FFD3F|nr:methyl-accepting chemotaxis protein [Bacillus methanolicus]MDE3841044.1 HAMP domain-containing protein [Bacillus methanolicus]